LPGCRENEREIAFRVGPPPRHLEALWGFKTRVPPANPDFLRRELSFDTPTGLASWSDLEPEALAFKPVMTGDAFVGLRVPDEPDPMDVMVAGHPCTIRRGATLVERVPCVRLVEHQWVPYERWPDYDQNHFPIPAVADIGQGRCAALWEWTAVPRDELLRGRRRVTLQDQGIYIFLQRLIHSLSRFAPPVTALKEASAHVLAEAELEYSWVMELLDGDPDSTHLTQLVSEFDAFMTAENR
jgi:hypothetical protein